MNLTPELLLEHFPDAPLWRLLHPDGKPYLHRYVLWGDDCLKNHSAATSHCFLHRINTSDGDRHCHNHPWLWTMSTILRGGYTEKRINGWGQNPTFHYYSAGDVSRMSTGYHSIVSVEPDTWTLFQAGPEISDWGFHVEENGYGAHIPHAEYFKRPDVQCMLTERIR